MKIIPSLSRSRSRWSLMQTILQAVPSCLWWNAVWHGNEKNIVLAVQKRAGGAGFRNRWKQRKELFSHLYKGKNAKNKRIFETKCAKVTSAFLVPGLGACWCL